MRSTRRSTTIAEFIERRVQAACWWSRTTRRERNAIVELIGGGDDVEITAVGSSEEALEELEREPLRLHGARPQAARHDRASSLLEQIKKDDRFRDLPVIIYTGKDLTRREETRLRSTRRRSSSRTCARPSGCSTRPSLFLHRVEARMPAEQRKMLEQLHTADAVFEGKKVLIVDDDVRNVFALASALEARGMEVAVRRERRATGSRRSSDNPDVDLVLMDIMMPEMDGYETTRADPRRCPSSSSCRSSRSPPRR